MRTGLNPISSPPWEDARRASGVRAKVAVLMRLGAGVAVAAQRGPEQVGRCTGSHPGDPRELPGVCARVNP